MLRRIFLVVVWMILSPLSAQNNAVSNLTDECVTEYDESVDYFPDKAEIAHSVGWEAEYFNHYKVIHILSPWPGASAEDVFQVVLVQCGAPIPDGFTDAQIIEVPVKTMIAMSTTYLAHLSELGLMDRLIGMDTFAFVNTPEVVARIESGELIEIGSGAGVNVELALDAGPDLIMTSGSGIPEFDAHPVLLDAGIFTAINSDWVEQSPLGRAEWIKFTAMFFNKEAEAERLFAEVAKNYELLASLTAGIDDQDKPLVLPNTFFGDSWIIPGTETYVGQFLHDAGGRMVLADLAGQGSAFLDFETVYDAGLQADFWLPGIFGVGDLGDLLAQDERYADLEPAQTGRIFNNDARVNRNGGNDYFESGVIHPDLILADLIAILHPDLLPDHELVYHRRLE